MTVVLILLCVFNLVMWAVFLFRFKSLFSTKKILEETRGTLDHMLLEINSNAERNINLIEDRIKKLQAVSAEADKRVSFLKAELAGAQKTLTVQEKAYEVPLPKKVPVEKKTRSPARRKVANPVQTYLENKVASEGEANVPNKVNSTPEIYKAKEQILPKKDKKSQLKELADFGYNEEEMAAKLGISPQEVKLILEFS